VFAALKEKKMKRTLLLGLALLAFALTPTFAQTAGMGKIHGHLTNPTGAAQTTGTVCLSTDRGDSCKASFPVSASGDYSGEVMPGTYMVIYRDKDTPAGKMVDSFSNVKIESGADVTQDFDMSRKEFVDKLPAEQREQLEKLKTQNAQALKDNAVIANLNNDLKVVTQDKKEIDGAAAAAQQALGASASRADLEAKINEIKTAKYTDIETLMQRDTGAKPDEALLWLNLAYAQAGLKKTEDAETSYKKALDLETNSKKPRPEVLGVIQAGLGEMYAKSGKVTEANAAFDASAKADPTRAAMEYKNEAVLFMQSGNAAAQVAAANQAIQTDPTLPIPYYIKGQGLVANATIDPKTNTIVLPQDCVDAYQKYLELAPEGAYANEVAGILSQAGQKVTTSYKAPGKTKSK
jgi:hypothetical protein